MFKRRLALALGLLVAAAALASSNGHDGHHHEEHEHVGREVRVPAEEEHGNHDHGKHDHHDHHDQNSNYKVRIATMLGLMQNKHSKMEHEPPALPEQRAEQPAQERAQEPAAAPPPSGEKARALQTLQSVILTIAPARSAIADFCVLW